MNVKTVREFEVGDVIACISNNWVAVRVATGKWKHTNHFDDFHDAYVDQLLDNESWIYLGNARNGGW